MYTFLLISLFVIIISSCFFKGKMTWDNNFLIACIIALISTITFVTTDMVTKDKTKTVITYNSAFNLLSIKYKTDSIDSIKQYKFYNDSNFVLDSIGFKLSINTHIVFLIASKDTVVYYMKNNGTLVSTLLKNIYFRKNTASNKAEVIIKTTSFDRKISNWYNPLSSNKYKECQVLILPPKEFDMIPKNCIKPEAF